jgi:heterodisulfide reductase subunit A
MGERIGVYICHCGTNIAGRIDVDGLAERVRDSLHDVAVSHHDRFLCSAPAQRKIQQDIRRKGLTRVVVAACSPHLHESTFRRACEGAGLNPYLAQITSIREQVAWVTPDPERATDKAFSVIAGAVERVRHHRPLVATEVPVNPRTLVVGGGIAGVQAALELADAGHPVVLVEREPSIGGRMAQFDRTFPTLDCAACILTPRMSEVGQHDNITLLTYAEVEQVSGVIGRFRVRVRKKARSIRSDRCTGCGYCQDRCPQSVPDEGFEAGLGRRKAIYIPFPQAVPRTPVIDRAACLHDGEQACRTCEAACPTEAIDFEQRDELVEYEVGNIVLATGYRMFDARQISQYGYGRYPDVFTSLEFERMCSPLGPTGGRVLLRDGRTEPRSIGIVYCVGSRDRNHNSYCSNVCCMSGLKYGHLAMEKTGADVYGFYVDMRPGFKDYEEFYERLLDEGMIFVRGRVAEISRADEPGDGHGKLVVHCEDTLVGRQRRIPLDMVILLTALEPHADAKQIARMCGISANSHGWFVERHAKLDPVATLTAGVFVAGACQGPKDIPASVAQGAAAASRVQATVGRGRVTVEPIVATVDARRCSGCRVCAEICPFHAIDFDEPAGVARIVDAACKGCGTCVAACPAGAIDGPHFTDRQIRAEIAGLLAEDRAAGGRVG